MSLSLPDIENYWPPFDDIFFFEINTELFFYYDFSIFVGRILFSISFYFSGAYTPFQVCNASNLIQGITAFESSFFTERPRVV